MDELTELQYTLQALQRLPKNFRDATETEWMEYWQLRPEKQEEMLAWQNGTTLNVAIDFDSLHGLERLVAKLIPLDHHSFLIVKANDNFIRGFNAVLSKFGFNCRLKKKE